MNARCGATSRCEGVLRAPSEGTIKDAAFVGGVTVGTVYGFVACSAAEEVRSGYLIGYENAKEVAVSGVQIGGAVPGCGDGAR